MANGYGYVWQPYGFANSMNAWDPYSAGAWMYSPGFGYGFASSYPWGWLPYHYGSWAYLNGIGWAWLPGGGYGGSNWYNNRFQAAPVVAKAPAGWTASAPPAVVANQSVMPTVVVGKVSSAAVVPGGRMPPNFGGAIHGRGAGASATGSSFAHANVQDHAMNDKAFATRYNAFDTHGAKSTHVFAAPPPVAAVASPAAAVGPGYSASSVWKGGIAGGGKWAREFKFAHASAPSHH